MQSVPNGLMAEWSVVARYLIDHPAEPAMNVCACYLKQMAPSGAKDYRVSEGTLNPCRRRGGLRPHHDHVRPHHRRRAPMVTMHRLFSWLTILGLSLLLLMGCVVSGSYSLILQRRRHRFQQSLARHFRARTRNVDRGKADSRARPSHRDFHEKIAISLARSRKRITLFFLLPSCIDCL